MCELSAEECDELNARICPLSHLEVEELKNVEHRMKQLFPERYQTQFLYHFTKPEVIGVWLSEYMADFRCTFYQHLNDRLEWLNGIEYIGEYVHRHEHDELVDTIESLPEKNGCAPWICSFSENDDSAAMWGMYGDRKLGGFAAGFDKNMMMQLVDGRNSKGEGDRSSPYDYWLLPCIYLGDPRLDKIIDYILYDAHTDEDEHLFREGCGDEVLARQISRLFFLTLIIKDSSFDYEREWRLIIRRVHEDSILENPSEVRFEGKAYVSPCLFDKPLREYISRIVVSPCGSNDKFINYAEMNYNKVCSLKEKYHLNFAVKRSLSPYRGL